MFYSAFDATAILAEVMVHHYCVNVVLHTSN